MIFEETCSLSNGVKIPKLGFGTWFIDDDKAAEAVRQALSLESPYGEYSIFPVFSGRTI